MISSRVWLFRGLVVVATGLMMIAWFMPWWSCDIVSPYLVIKDAAVIHPYGLALNLGTFVGYTAGSEMPVWFAPLMWAYLVICIALLLFSLFAREKAFRFGKFRLSLPQVLIGGVGLTCIVGVVVAVIYASIRLKGFYGTNLIGRSHFSLVENYVEGDAYARLLPGYWLACGVGPLLIVLALLRDKIMGKPTLIIR